MIFWVIFGILFELIILAGVVCLVLKYVSKLKSPSAPIEVKVSNKNITSEVIRDGFKDAIKELEFEKEKEKENRNMFKNPESMYSSTPQDEPVRHSGGNLIPFGLTESEKASLEMFYGDNED